MASDPQQRWQPAERAATPAPPGPAACRSPSLLTRFVSRLDPAGQRVTAAEVDAVLAALRELVERELKRRGLWGCSPRLLGVFGARRWSVGADGRSDALDELVHGCYLYTFVERLRSLKEQLATKAELDGLVVLNVRHFLFERQRAHDPIGYRVYQLLLAAVRRALAAGEVAVAGGGFTVRRSSVLLFGPSAPIPPPAPAAALGDLAAPLGDLLVPDFATARGTAATALEERLRRELARLPALGVEAARFQDLVGVVKDEVRRRWSRMFEAPRATPPAPAAPHRQQEAVAELAACVEAGIEAAVHRPKTRADLRRLWTFFRAYAEETERLPATVLSSRRLAREVDVSRERVPRLLDTLQEIVRRCRQPRSAVATAAEGDTIALRAKGGGLA